MEIKKGIYKLKGKLMNYAWGGYEFLPSLLHVPNPDHAPCAEYWLGAHPLASSMLVTPAGEISLYELIQQHPEQFLSQQTLSRFGQLPYLLKVLDVREVLSIQVHPDKSGAEEGFAAEEAAGIPVDAPHRNYKDRNHKPETMVALGEFWLLHGFQSSEAIEKVLEDVPEFNILLPLFRKEGLKALYRFVMEMEQADVNVMLLNLIKRELRKKQAGELSKEDPGWWVARLFNGGEIGHIDRAIFSIYFFNIVRVNAGESIFQGAGLPHAYMEGQCVELMANSDNVLRAGLTPKHIDVPELMKHTVFESITPRVMKGDPLLDGEKIYPCPVAEFGITRIELDATVGRYTRQASSLEILIVTAGGMLINNSLVLKRGEAAAVMAGESYEISASGNCEVFRAFVPEQEG